MTELDATQIAEIDQREALPRIRSAKGPEEVLRIVQEFCFHRVRGLDEGKGILVAKRELLKKREAKKLSTLIGQTLEGLMISLTETIEPEDNKAFVSWMIGNGQEPEDPQEIGQGFASLVLSVLKDSSSKAELARIRSLGGEIRGQIMEEDRSLMAQAMDELNAAELEMVMSRRRDAKKASGNGEYDGETARAQSIEARRVAIMLLERGRAISAKISYEAR